MILKSGNVCYHSVQNLLYSRLLSKIVNIRINKIIILPMVLYGCGTWSLKLRDVHRLRVLESRVLWRFGPKRVEVTGGWRKLHNEELRDLYSSPSTTRIIKRRTMRWAGHVADEWGRIGTRQSEGKTLLGRPIRRRVDNIRMDLGEVGWDDVDWNGLAQDRNRWKVLVNSVLNFRVPQNAGKLWSGLTTCGLSSSAQLHRVSSVTWIQTKYSAILNGITFVVSNVLSKAFYTFSG
jgi:hypothetical protein